jgi:hypothetical protein
MSTSRFGFFTAAALLLAAVTSAAAQAPFPPDRALYHGTVDVKPDEA